jgi:hypothetical protein
MNTVNAIHIQSNKPTKGFLLESLNDLEKIKYRIHPLAIDGIKKILINQPVFINLNGGYCYVKIYCNL